MRHTLLMMALMALALSTVQAATTEYHIGDGVSAYRVLKIAPWSSMNDIKDKYKALKRKADFFERDELEEAMKVIKKEREEYHYEDDKRLSVVSLVWWTLVKAVGIEAGFGVAALVFYMLNKFQGILSAPLFFIVLAFELVSKLIPYYFESSTTQYAFSFVLGMILYAIKEVVFKLFYKIWPKEKIS